MPMLGWLLWLVLVVCAVWTIRLYRQRLLAVIVLGGAGLMVSLAFVFLSAPDLALTQLMVEMVSLILLLLGLHYLPPRSPPERTPRRRLRDIVVALAAGTGVGTLAYQMMMRPADTITGVWCPSTNSSHAPVIPIGASPCAPSRSARTAIWSTSGRRAPNCGSGPVIWSR